MPVKNKKENKKIFKMVGDYRKLIPYFIKHFNSQKNEYKEDENVEMD